MGMPIKIVETGFELPLCPEATQSVFYPAPRCNLNDKPCVLNQGIGCPYYEEFLDELGGDNVGKM